MTKLSFDLTRRRFLRQLGLGAGAGLVGPVADGLVRRALGNPMPPQKRLLLFAVYSMEREHFLPEGVDDETWHEVPAVQQPWPAPLGRLAPYHQKMVLVDGLGNDIGNNHQHRAGTSALSCVPPAEGEPEHFGPSGGPTIDQVIARELSDGRPHRSVLWGLSGDGVASGRRLARGMFAAGRNQNLSHFEHADEMANALFPDNGDQPSDRSAPFPFRPVRDRILPDLNRLRAALAPEDRIGLERYEEAVVDFDERQAAAADMGCPSTAPSPVGGDVQAESHLVSMMNQTALVFQCGLTNVVGVSIGTSNNHNQHMPYYAEMSRRYEGPGDGPKYWHHGAKDTEDNMTQAMTTRRLFHETHYREIATLLETLANTQESDGSSALDHTVVCYTSGNSVFQGSHHGWHTHHWSSLLIAGDQTDFHTAGRYMRFRTHHQFRGEPAMMAEFYRALALGLGVNPGNFAGMNTHLETLLA